jgi:hypothetical protein
MSNDTTQILSLLIIIQVALFSYYYILHKDTVSKKEEDKLILQLEEKFSDKNLLNLNNKNSKEEFIPAICNGFHDKFFNNSKYLGWRLFYLKNQNKQMVEPDTNFKGIITQNYLNNLPNVQNDVTPLKYQIR